MKIEDFVGRTVTLYLEGGHVIIGKVYEISSIRTITSNGNIARYEVLVIILNDHTTFVRFDKISAYEIY